MQNALAHLLRDAAALSRSAGAADVMRCRQSPRASVEAAGEAVTHCMRACTRLRARGARRRAKYLSLERVQLSAHFFLACLMHRTCDAPERRPWPRAPGPALAAARRACSGRSHSAAQGWCEPPRPPLPAPLPGGPPSGSRQPPPARRPA